MNNFKTITLEEAKDAIIDYRGKTPQKSEEGIRLITAKVVKSGVIIDERAEYVSSDYFDMWMTRGLTQAGDIVMTTEAPLGEIAILDSKKYALGQRIITIRANPKKMNSKYMYFAMQSDYVQNELIKRATGTTVLGIKQTELLDVSIPYYPLETQVKIAYILEAYTTLIENNNRRISILEEMAQKLYREWFVHFRFPGHENVKMVESEMGLIPEGWEIKKLIRIADIIMGQSPKSECYNENGEGLPFHQGVTNFTLLVPEHKTYSTGGSRIANSGDILFSVRAPVGRINLADCKLVLGRGISAIRHKANHQGYLLFTLKTIFDKPDLIGSGSIFNSVTKDDMHSIAVLTPHKDIESSFDKVAQQIVNQLILLNAKNTNLRKTRDLLLPRLISGNIDVSKLDIPTKEG